MAVIGHCDTRGACPALAEHAARWLALTAARADEGGRAEASQDGNALKTYEAHNEVHNTLYSHNELHTT